MPPIYILSTQNALKKNQIFKNNPETISISLNNSFEHLKLADDNIQSSYIRTTKVLDSNMIIENKRDNNFTFLYFGNNANGC